MYFDLDGTFAVTALSYGILLEVFRTFLLCDMTNITGSSYIFLAFVMKRLSL